MQAVNSDTSEMAPSNNRTVLNIIWSCVATIALCIWASIHPNVPDADETMTKNVLRRLKLAMFALIAPELVIAWAVRQQFAARNVVRTYKDRNWTMVHGFFICMGGFSVIGDDGSSYALTPDRFQALIDSKVIDFPTTTKSEIEDRSKGDIFSKGFAIGQTLWFVLQVIARAVAHLPITELELVTVAFSLLNLFTYALWMGKPLHVQCSIPIHQKNIPKMQQDLGAGKSTGESKGNETRHASGMRLAFAMITKNGILGTIKYNLWFVIKNGVLLPIPRLIVGGYHMGLSEHASHTRVATFYAGILTDLQGLCAAVATAVVAAIFGCVHCIAWSFSFPTDLERTVWRVSSVVITSVPVFYLVLFSFVSLCLHRDSFILPSQLRHLLENLFRLVVLSCTLLYVVARVALLIMPFTSLRSPLHGARQTISWIAFIPHIQ